MEHLGVVVGEGEFVDLSVQKGLERERNRVKRGVVESGIGVGGVGVITHCGFLSRK